MRRKEKKMKMSNWKKMMVFVGVLLCGFLITGRQTYASPGDGWGSYGDNITWNYTASSGLLEIKGIGEMLEDVTDYRDDYPWVSYADGVQKIVISEGVTSVSRYAFSEYDNLKEVQLPSTMKKIGWGAFRRCEKLAAVNLPQGLIEINAWAFAEASLQSVTIPGTVATIGAAAFVNNSTLKKVILQEGIQEIELECFQGTGINNVTIPNSVTTIGWHAFQYSDLVYVDIPSSVTSLGNWAFCNCKQLELVKIGEGIKAIENCFSYNDSLKAIYIPESVSSIAGESSEFTIYGYTGSAAWDYAGSHSNVDFVDVSTADGQAAWNALWNECVNRKEVSSDNNSNGNSIGGGGVINSKKTIPSLKVTAKKGKKSITIKTLKGSKIVITMNKKIMKNGTKKVKKITIKKCKARNVIKLSKKLPKNTKITVRVTKSGYKARSRMQVVK